MVFGFRLSLYISSNKDNATFASPQRSAVQMAEIVEKRVLGNTDLGTVSKAFITHPLTRRVHEFIGLEAIFLSCIPQKSDGRC